MILRFFEVNRVRKFSTNLYDNSELAPSNHLRSSKRLFHSTRIVNRSQKFLILERSKIIKFHRSLWRLLRSNGVVDDLGRFVQVLPNVATPQQHGVLTRSIRYVFRTLPAILGNLGEGEYKLYWQNLTVNYSWSSALNHASLIVAGLCLPEYLCAVA